MLFDLVAEVENDKKRIPGAISILLLVLATALFVIPANYKTSINIELLQGISFCIIFFVWYVARKQRVCLKNDALVHEFIAQYHHLQEENSDEFFEELSCLDEAGYPVDEVLGLYDSSVAKGYAVYRKGGKTFKGIVGPRKIPVDGQNRPAWMRKENGMSHGLSYPFLPEKKSDTIGS